MKKKLFKLLILVLIAKEIVPLNEEYLLITSFTIFIYLFYKVLINFFYNVFSEQTMFLDAEFENIYFEQEISIKLLKKTLKKSSQFFYSYMNFNNNFIPVELINLWLQKLSNKTHPLVKLSEFKNQITLLPVTDWAAYELLTWLVLEETLFYQDWFLKSIDSLVEHATNF